MRAIVPVEIVETIVELYINFKAAVIQRWWRIHKQSTPKKYNCIRPPWCPIQPIVDERFLCEFFMSSAFL